MRRIRLPLSLKLLLLVGALLAGVAWVTFEIIGRAHPHHVSLADLGYIFLAIFAALLILYLVLQRTIDFPVRQIISVAQKIGKGYPGLVAEIDRVDELAPLVSTLRKLADEIRTQHLEITEQREIYQRLFEAAPCLITVQDKDFRVIRHNKYFADHFPVKEGMRCFEAYKNQTWKCESCPTEQTFENGQSHCSEENGFYKDGTRANWIVTTSPLHDTKGNVMAAISISLDITARKKLEEELKRSEKKYYAIFNNIPYAVFLMNAQDLSIMDCNQAATILYGYTKGELIGKPFRAFFAQSDWEIHGHSFKTLKEIRRVKHGKKNGNSFFVTICLSTPEYQVGQKVLLAVVMDITESIEAEQQLVQANKMATLGEMATGVAHELNQPLSVVKMVADFFTRRIENGQLADEESQRIMADKLRSNVARASKIINHMREFGRKSSAAAEPVNLNDVIARSLDFFSQQLKLRDIRIIMELEENLPMIKADPNHLEQVFVNLLINARDAIEEKHSRTPGGQEEGQITIRTRSKRRFVSAEVRDTGTGIPHEIANKIFEPFFTTKQVGKGTGLGLSISYGIVTDYGGTIHAISHEGGGASFRITFPRTN